MIWWLNYFTALIFLFAIRLYVKYYCAKMSKFILISHNSPCQRCSAPQIEPNHGLCFLLLRVKASPACSWKGKIAACLRDSCRGSRHCAARGSRRLAEKETRRGLSLLAIDRLPLIFLASCYSDWNIILEIPLLEYPTQLTRLLEQRLQHVTSRAADTQ